MSKQSDRPEKGADVAHALAVQHCIGNRRHARQQQAHVGAGVAKLLRQRTQHVGKPAGLDQREDLGADVEDFHAPETARSISRVTSVIPPSVR